MPVNSLSFSLYFKLIHAFKNCGKVRNFKIFHLRRSDCRHCSDIGGEP